MRTWIDRNGKTAGAIIALLGLAAWLLKVASRAWRSPWFEWLFASLPWLPVVMVTVAFVLAIRVLNRSRQPPPPALLSQVERTLLNTLAASPNTAMAASDVARMTRVPELNCEAAAMHLEACGLVVRGSEPLIHRRLYSLTEEGVRYISSNQL